MIVYKASAYRPSGPWPVTHVDPIQNYKLTINNQIRLSLKGSYTSAKNQNILHEKKFYKILDTIFILQ